MFRISLTSLWAHKRRLAGIATAVILGVSFLTGTLVLGDTLSSNFDQLFTDVSSGTDVVVRNGTVVESDDGPDNSRGPISVSFVDEIQAVDGVDEAVPQVVGYGALIGQDGDPIGGNGPPRLAGSWIEDEDLNPYELVEGRAPEQADEVVVNRGAADSGALKLGDTAVLQTPAPVEVEIVGISTFGDTDGLGETTWTAFSLEGAQENVTRQPDMVSTILAKADAGVSSDELRDRISTALGDDVDAITGSQLADERTDEIGETFLNGLRMFLVVFAGIAVVVATLSIANTFSITIAQRTRELALLRAVGATRRQVRRAVTVEAVALGSVASVIGIAGGLGIAALLKVMFDAFGFGLPAGGMEIRPLSIAAGLIVGIAATMIAAQSAARRASRLSPVAALTDVQAEARTLTRRRIIAGVTTLATGAAATLFGTVDGNLIVAGTGALLSLVGTLMVAPVAMLPAARVIGGTLQRLPLVGGRKNRVNGMMARENARRSPRRSAATATALIVGVAVVSLFTVFVSSLQASMDEQLSDDFGADLAINTEAFGGGRLSADAAEQAVALDEIDTAVGLGGGPVLVNGDSTQATATDAALLGDVAAVETVDGSLAAATGNGIAIDEKRAEDEGWKVGTELELTFNDGSTESGTVEAIYGENQLIGSMVIDAELWEAHTTQPSLRTVLMSLADGVSGDQARGAVEPIADELGGEVQDGSEYASAATEGFDMLLGVVYALLALAVLIALLGIGNTLSLAVFERRRELGLLRAVGQTRRQVRSVLRLESVIIASFGTVVGLVLGSFLGWALFATVANSSMVSGLGLSFELPVFQLGLIAVLGALAGVLAARRPARRAARTPILEAIATT